MICPHCQAPNADDARFCGACGRATVSTDSSAPSGATPTPDMIGKVIAGRYRIGTKLGEGGMGAVYKAEQISLKRTVAVKLLRPEVASSQLLLRRFNAEAEAVAKLSHPNTVNIYDFGQDSDGTLFIAMELIEGKSLRSVVHHEAPLPLRRALVIASQVAASLTDAHGHAIIHRDLKPDNVMLQDRGRQRDVVRVLDFGIAKLRDEGRATQMQMTQAGDMLGTPQYMAPEQIRAESIDGRTDVYALGCMLYEMITGRLPFEGPTVMALLSKHLLEPVVPPSQRRPDLMIPPEIERLILSAMAKEPRDRPPSMEVFGEQIAELLAMLPPDAYASGPGPLSRQSPSTPASFAPQTPIAPSAYPQPGAAVATAPAPTPHHATPPIATFSPPPPSAPAFPPPPGVTLPPPQGPASVAPTSSGKGLIMVIALLALGIGGFAVYWFALRSPAATTTVDDAATLSTPAPTPTPTPTQDPWNDHAPTTVPGTLPDGLELLPVPGFERSSPSPNVLALVDQAHAIAIGVAPITTARTEPKAMAEEYARENKVHFDGLSSIESHGEERAVGYFSGSGPAGAFKQMIVIYEMGRYRVGAVIQAPPQLLDQSVFKEKAAQILETNLVLP